MANLDYSDVITTAVLPDALRVIYSNELEFTSRPMLVYDQLCESKNDFVAKRGERVYWTIARQLPPSIGKLTENQDIAAKQMSDFQVSFTVDEYGDAIGTTEKIDLLSYFGPISNIIKAVLGPQMALTVDITARNVFFDPAQSTYRNYGGTPGARATREALTSGDVTTAETLRNAGYNLSVRRIPLKGSNYVGIAHPAQVYDLRKDSAWIDANKYAGSTAIFNGEEGMLHGVRMIKSDMARLPNGGLPGVQTTLSAAVQPNQNTIQVTSAAGLAVGMEISLFQTGYTTGGGAVVPNGTDPGEEHVVIASISGTTVTLRTACLLAHASGDKVVDGVDVFPVVFMGNLPAVGKGVVVSPEVRVALPTDKLRRMSYVGWYGLYGYGMLRSWAVEVWETASSATSSAPAFQW